MRGRLPISSRDRRATAVIHPRTVSRAKSDQNRDLCIVGGLASFASASPDVPPHSERPEPYRLASPLIRQLPLHRSRRRRRTRPSGPVPILAFELRAVTRKHRYAWGRRRCLVGFPERQQQAPAFAEFAAKTPVSHVGKVEGIAPAIEFPIADTFASYQRAPSPRPECPI